MSAKRVDYIGRTCELYAPTPAYRWADNRALEVPWTPLTKPIARSRVLLVGTGGIYLEGQDALGLQDDASIRIIPSDTPTAELRASHFGYPTVYAQEDPNCVFPLERLRELVAEGTVGELASTAVGSMGGIYSQRKVTEELAPAILAHAQRERADLVLLVPA